MYVHRPDARIFYQVTGSGTRDLLLLPQCQVVTYSRMWKHQIPYLSRYFRVITMDPRGNGRSDRPPTGYDLDTRYGDLVAVLDEVARPPIALVAFSCAAPLAFRYAVEHPGRLSHLILLSGQYAESVPQPFEERVARVIRDDFDNWRARLFKRIFPEPHSLKGIEDCVTWAGETTPEVLIESLRAIDGINLYDLLGQVRVPTLALHGTDDKIVPYSHAQKMVAAIPGAHLVTFERGGHGLFGRDAVKVNRFIRDFALGREIAETSIPATTQRTVPAAAPSPAAPSPAPPRRPRDSPPAAGAGSRRHRRLPRRRSRRPRGPARGGAPAPGDAAAPERDQALRGLGRRSRAARVQRAVGHGRDHDRQLHDPRRRGGARAVRSLDRRRGMGPRLLPARESRPQAGALRLPHRLHRPAPDAGRPDVDRVHPLLGEERGERRSPAPASRRARPLDPGRRRGGRARSRVRPRSPEHAAVGAGALPLLRLHLPLRSPGPARPRRRAGGARLPGGRARDPGLRRGDAGRAEPAPQVRGGLFSDRLPDPGNAPGPG